MGFTLVCKSPDGRIKEEEDMVRSCFAAPESRSTNDKSCSCIPTRIVEEDLETQTNPLGKERSGCIKVEEDMVLKGLEGTIIE